MFVKERDYQRKHLRAPYHFEVLFTDGEHVHKCRAINISEGGLLLDHISFFPENNLVPIMLSLPQFPFFKNFSTEKLRAYSLELLPGKVIRLNAEIVRKMGVKLEDVFSSFRVGLKFCDLKQENQKLIADYVKVFASNIIYLQILLDSINADKENLEKIRILSGLLGYDSNMKLALLRKKLSEDYLSLQWL